MNDFEVGDLVKIILGRYRNRIAEITYVRYNDNYTGKVSYDISLNTRHNGLIRYTTIEHIYPHQFKLYKKAIK